MAENQEPTTTPTAGPTEPTPKTRGKIPHEPYVEIGENDEGWHWQLYAANGQPVCRNSMAYKTKKHCVQAIRCCPGIWAKVQVIVAVDEPDEKM